MSELEEVFAFQIRAAKLPAPEREVRFHPVRRWRFDFAWPSRKLAVEIDGATWSGGRHSRGAGIERDAEKYSTAAATGWRVLRGTRAMVEDGRLLVLVEEALSVEEAP